MSTFHVKLITKPHKFLQQKSQPVSLLAAQALPMHSCGFLRLKLRIFL